MRPTDEDQPGSRRPNLMASSRRSASDVNILAMLDGLGSRPHAKRTMLWYGAGAALACALIGLLAWVVHEPSAQLDSTMVAGGLPPAPMPIERERVAETLPAPPAPQAPAGGATIVNVAAEPAAMPSAMPDAPAAPSSELAASPDDPPPLPAPKPAAAPRAPAPRSPAVHAAPVHPALAVHPRVAHANPKRGGPAIKPVPAPAAVDTDVALISAIIQHASARHDAAEDGSCGDKPCGPRMPPQP